jgi:hypothetical protein
MLNNQQEGIPAENQLAICETNIQTCQEALTKINPKVAEYQKLVAAEAKSENSTNKDCLSALVLRQKALQKLIADNQAYITQHNSAQETAANPHALTLD